MASQITSIYSAIQAIDIAVGGVTVNTKGLTEHDGQIRQLPVRILTPIHSSDDAPVLQPMTFGNRSTIEWRITDLMLWARVTDGSGIEYHTSKLVEYMGAFVDAFVSTDRNLGLSNVVVNNVQNLEMGVYNYPAEGNQHYYGVKTVWFVRENL